MICTRCPFVMSCWAGNLGRESGTITVCPKCWRLYFHWSKGRIVIFACERRPEDKLEVHHFRTHHVDDPLYPDRHFEVRACRDCGFLSKEMMQEAFNETWIDLDAGDALL